jgi:hypothetical protein
MSGRTCPTLAIAPSPGPPMTGDAPATSAGSGWLSMVEDWLGITCQAIQRGTFSSMRGSS